MSNGIADVSKDSVFAMVTDGQVTQVGKVGSWMPWGSGFKGESYSVITRDEENSILYVEGYYASKPEVSGDDKSVEVGEAELQWGIEWNEDQPSYPNAVAHVYAYPGDYLEIGRYDGEKWQRYGGIDDDEKLLPHYEKFAHVIKWDEAYKHLPALHILYPSESSTPGGKSEDIKEFFSLTAYKLALRTASEESFKLSENAMGFLGLSDIHIDSPESITYSFVSKDGNGENPKTIDVQLQVKVTATATR